MGTASVHEGVRRMRFESLLGRQERGELTQIEAAEMLGVSVRTLQRWASRFEEGGVEGLADRRLGRASPRRAPAEELERMLGLYRDKYADFTAKHFHEQLVKRHGYQLGYTVTKLTLRAAGLVRPAPKRSAHRKKRYGSGQPLLRDAKGWREGLQDGVDAGGTRLCSSSGSSTSRPTRRRRGGAQFLCRDEATVRRVLSERPS